MSDRVILALKFTPAGAPSQVRRAVGGFLRYVQHRDLHPTPAGGRSKPEVAGLLKYVAYRERASARAELFGPSGTLDSSDRKAFAAFAAGALEGSRPQLYRGRNGEMQVTCAGSLPSIAIPPITTCIWSWPECAPTGAVASRGLTSPSRGFRR
jgi:hypothetical protein